MNVGLLLKNIDQGTPTPTLESKPRHLYIVGERTPEISVIKTGVGLAPISV